MQAYRAVKAPLVKYPEAWGVQQFRGYVDGRPSYQLVKRFVRKSDAVAFAALKECGLDTEDVCVEAT